MQIKVDNGILISSIIAFFRLACFIRGTGGVGWGRAFKFLWDFQEKFLKDGAKSLLKDLLKFEFKKIDQRWRQKLPRKSVKI